MVSKIFQLNTDGDVFDGKEKPIGRSEHLESVMLEKTGEGLIVITFVSVTELHGPVGLADVRVKVIDPIILGVKVVCRLFTFPNAPPFEGVTDQVPVLAPPVIVPLIGMVVPAHIVVSFPAFTTGLIKKVTIITSLTALHGPGGLSDVNVSVTLKFAIS